MPRWFKKNIVFGTFINIVRRWLFGTFYKGLKKDFEIDDLYEPLKEHKSDYLGNVFER